jgi:hypothetical protein
MCIPAELSTCSTQRHFILSCIFALLQHWNIIPVQVRSAVRALTLNVYSIEDPKVQTFVCSPPASSYFQELAISLVEQCQVRSSDELHGLLSPLLLHPVVGTACCHARTSPSDAIWQRLDGALASVREGRSTAEHPVEAALAEVEDLLLYCNDIIGTGARLHSMC